MWFSKRAISLLFFNCCLHLILFDAVSCVPQWVWNKDIGRGDSGTGSSGLSFAEQSNRYPISAQTGTKESDIRTARLIPGVINSVSNSIQGITGGGSGGGGGGVNGIFGAVLQALPQLANQAISGIFNRPPINLPAKDPGNGIISGGLSPGGGSSSGSINAASCTCVEANLCFLPFKPTGSCSGGRTNCCSTSTRAVFPDDISSSSSNFGSSNFGSTNAKIERTVSQRQVRRGLLQQILRGSGDLLDDTLDLILTPYLSKEDQQRLATRVLVNE